MKHPYKRKKINGKTIQEHRWIMQNYLKRILKRNEIVHHKNGNKKDNRLSNLEVQTLSEHSSNFMKKRLKQKKMKPKLRAWGRKGGLAKGKKIMEQKVKNGKYLCGNCHQFLDKAQFNNNKTKKTGLQSWCKECCKKKRNSFISKDRCLPSKG
jgi:hypothetical protein